MLLRTAAGVIFLTIAAARAPGAESGPTILPMFPDPASFRAAIGRVRDRPPSTPVTGLIVPHHLLVIDLIARGFALAAGRRPDRIVLLAPDHYRRSRTPIAVCARDLDTALGRVPVDRETVQQILQDTTASASSLFSHDHAVQALAPFLAHHFPGVPALVVAIHPKAGPETWRKLAERLAPFAGPGTLVVQSTDFSHFLSWKDSIRHDQESLGVIAAGDPAEVARLKQPQHLDGRGALAVTMDLQRRLGARPLVVANRNSSEYAPEPVAKTTSYMVVLYGAPELEVAHPATVMFGGDTFTGRGMTRRLETILPRARANLRGYPAILNLEGVFASGPPPSPAPGRPDLGMEAGPALAALASLGTRAVSLANNHALDRGPEARALTRDALEAAGIAALLTGETRDLGEFALSALTDCDNSHEMRRRLLGVRDLDELPPPPREEDPWIVFLHGGEEWAEGPAPRDRDVVRRLAARGVDLVVGAHTHRPGAFFLEGGVPAVFSLGNFLFDQTDPRAGGQLLEVRFFAQGTFAMRLLPL